MIQGADPTRTASCMAPPEAGKAIMTQIPGDRFEYLPGVRHLPYLEAPERTAEFIAEFLPSGSRYYARR